MFSSKKFLLLALLLCLASLPARAQDDNASDAGKPSKPKLKIDWLNGPATANLKDMADIQVPAGYRFANAADTRKIMERFGNPTSGSEVGFLAPTNMAWFVVFEFNDTGYIKDDDKDKLDPDAMLKAIQRGNDETNKERKSMGAAPLTIVGWERPPKYNPDTHNLEWAIRAEAEGSPVLNFNTRLLGRKGVMEADLVVEPDRFAEVLPDFETLLQSYQYKQGERYAEYRQGDKIAKYGLAALVTGGAAVVAVKSGLLGYLLLFAKKAWVLIAAAVAAVTKFFKRLVSGKREKSNMD